MIHLILLVLRFLTSATGEGYIMVTAAGLSVCQFQERLNIMQRTIHKIRGWSGSLSRYSFFFEGGWWSQQSYFKHMDGLLFHLWTCYTWWKLQFVSAVNSLMELLQSCTKASMCFMTILCNCCVSHSNASDFFGWTCTFFSFAISLYSSNHVLEVYFTRVSEIDWPITSTETLHHMHQILKIVY